MEDYEKIALSRTTFSRLQGIGEPLVDTAESVIIKLLDFYDNQTAPSPQMADETEECFTATERASDLVFFPGSLPRLLHAKIKRVIVDGEQQDCDCWQDVVEFLLVKACEKHENVEHVISLCKAPNRKLRVVRGERGMPGWRYIGRVDLSFRRIDADGCCLQIDALASAIGVRVTLDIQWLQIDKADYPGRDARLELGYSAGGSQTESRASGV